MQLQVKQYIRIIGRVRCAIHLSELGEVYSVCRNGIYNVFREYSRHRLRAYHTQSDVADLARYLAEIKRYINALSSDECDRAKRSLISAAGHKYAVGELRSVFVGESVVDLS